MALASLQDLLVLRQKIERKVEYELTSMRIENVEDTLGPTVEIYLQDYIGTRFNYTLSRQFYYQLQDTLNILPGENMNGKKLFMVSADKHITGFIPALFNQGMYFSFKFD